MRSEDGIDVFRKFMSSNTIGSKYACVRCSVVINAPPLKVFELFEDNTRVKEYNSLFVEGK